MIRVGLDDFDRYSMREIGRNRRERFEKVTFGSSRDAGVDSLT